MSQELIPLFEGDDDFEYGDDRKFLEELEFEAEQDAIDTVSDFRKRQGKRYMRAQERMGYQRMLLWARSRYGQGKTTVSRQIREAKGEEIYAKEADQKRILKAEVPKSEPHPLEQEIIPEQAESLPGYTEEALEQAREEGIEEGLQRGREEQLEKDKAVLAKHKERVAYLNSLKESLEIEVQNLKNAPKSKPKQSEIEAAEERLSGIRIEIRKAEKQLDSQKSIPRMRDLQGETQQRILNDWATTSHAFVMGANSYLAHIPDSISLQQFDADAWQRLIEVEQVIIRILEVHRSIKNVRDGSASMIVEAV